MKLANLSKILKCAGNDDAITMKSEDNGDHITFMFEAPGAWGYPRHSRVRAVTHRAPLQLLITHHTCPPAGQERLSEFDLKLMDIDSEHLGIPDNEYDATVKLPSSEFQRIVKDLATLGDTVEISVTKDAVKFATSGDIGSANIMCRQNKSVDKPEEATEIDINEPVALTFALRYLNSFAKVCI